MTLYSSIYTVVKPLLQILCSTKSSTIPLRTRSWGGLGYIGFECNFRCPVRLGYAGPLAATLKKDTSFSHTLSQYFKSHASALDTPWPPEYTCCLESLCNDLSHHYTWRMSGGRKRSTMNDILWDTHKYTLWALPLFFPSDHNLYQSSKPGLL